MQLSTAHRDLSPSSLVLVLLVFVLGGSPAYGAIRSEIIITSSQPPNARVVLELDTPVTEWSFPNTYGSVVGLAERIMNITAFNEHNQQLKVITIAPGVYRASGQINEIRYDVSLVPPKRHADWSHVSWITEDRGLLMLSDVLPEFVPPTSSPLRLKIALPLTWTAVSSSAQIDGYYTISEPDKAVFMLGSSLRVVSKNLNGRKFRVVMNGDWPFTASDVIKTAVRVIEENSRVTATAIPDRAILMLVPMTEPPSTWTAETRGESIVLLLSNKEAKRQLLARLGVILAHESLHLWVPNSLKLRGNYDWFFEGFTLYQALITARRVQLIDFDEYLNTLARVNDSYLLAEERDRFSLPELSERRWTTASSLVYDKGMLVAMIYDLRVRALTQGRAGLSNVYQKLMKTGSTAFADGNEVIISLLDEAPGLSDFSSTFVTRPNRIELEKVLTAYGISTRRENFQTRFAVERQLEQGQKAVLRSLGYKK